MPSGIIHVIVFTNRRDTCHRTTFITPALSHAANVSPCTCMSSAFFACMASNCTHRTHHRCVFGVIMHTPPRICTPSTIGPAARSFHPIRPPLLEAPTPPHRPTLKLPTRSGRRHAQTRHTHRADSHARMHSTHISTHTHAHEHKQTLSFSRHLYFTRYLVNLIKRSD